MHNGSCLFGFLGVPVLNVWQAYALDSTYYNL